VAVVSCPEVIEVDRAEWSEYCVLNKWERERQMMELLDTQENIILNKPAIRNAMA